MSWNGWECDDFVEIGGVWRGYKSDVLLALLIFLTSTTPYIGVNFFVYSYKSAIV